VDVDTTKWSGEGEFTAKVIEHLKTLDAVEFLRVEDAPASRADEAFSFISNEIYVRFRTEPGPAPHRRFGIFPAARPAPRPVMTLAGLEAALAAEDVIGSPDYGDEEMLQYLRTERIVPPYQTRGYKLVELLRLYWLKT
jgi:hypothetical protein